MGQIYVIDGLDGCGKATQAEAVRKQLEARGNMVHILDYPCYDKPSSALVKQYLNGDISSNPEDVNAYAAASFYACDRYIDYMKEWKEIYHNTDDIFIANRYTTSNLLLQMAKLDKSYWYDFEKWLEEYEYGLLGLPKPDKVIILDVPIEVSQELLNKRYSSKDKRDIHERDTDFLKRCHRTIGYLVLKPNWVRISCTDGGVLLKPEEVTKKVMEYIDGGENNG